MASSATSKAASRASARSRAPRRTKHHGNRYGRSEEAREAVLEAADDLLAEVGFAAVTIEGIAARAGVGKQTIYRWWKSKTDILMDAFLDDALEYLKPQDTGDLQRDLLAHAGNLAKFLTQTDAGQVFRALSGQAQHDESMAKRFRQDYLQTQRQLDRLPFERAAKRGELDAAVDIELAVDQLVGPIYYRVLVTGESVDGAFTTALVNALLTRSLGVRPLTPGPGQPSAPDGQGTRRQGR